MALTAELGKKVEAIYREHLEKEFPATVKFDTIRVEPAEDSEGRDTFRVTVVYDDGNERPNPKTRGTVLASLMDPLGEPGAAASTHRVLRPPVGISDTLGPPGRTPMGSG